MVESWRHMLLSPPMSFAGFEPKPFWIKGQVRKQTATTALFFFFHNNVEMWDLSIAMFVFIYENFGLAVLVSNVCMENKKELQLNLTSRS